MNLWSSALFSLATIALVTSPLTAAAEEGHGMIAIVLTNHGELGDTGVSTGFYLSEASHPWQAFTDAGYEVVFVSPEGGPAPIDPKSLSREDPANAAFLDTLPVSDGALPTARIAGISSASFAAVFVAGGHGTMWDLPDHLPLQDLLSKVYGQGGVVAAVCHGPAALVNVRLEDGRYLVAGRRVAAFTDDEEAAVELVDVVPFLLESTLRERGAVMVPGPDFQANVVVSDRLVTGQNPASAQGAADAVLELLGASSHADRSGTDLD
ncbi:MAG: type 1 glutamine amidotransferase domain-containing protein [Planctomycetota bacterium]